jgi:hypothetical protein
MSQRWCSENMHACIRMTMYETISYCHTHALILSVLTVRCWHATVTPVEARHASSSHYCTQCVHSSTCCVRLVNLSTYSHMWIAHVSCKVRLDNRTVQRIPLYNIMHPRLVSWGMLAFEPFRSNHTSYELNHTSTFTTKYGQSLCDSHDRTSNDHKYSILYV